MHCGKLVSPPGLVSQRNSVETMKLISEHLCCYFHLFVINLLGFLGLFASIRIFKRTFCSGNVSKRVTGFGGILSSFIHLSVSFYIFL